MRKKTTTVLITLFTAATMLFGSMAFSMQAFAGSAEEAASSESNTTAVESAAVSAELAESDAVTSEVQSTETESASAATPWHVVFFDAAGNVYQEVDADDGTLLAEPTEAPQAPEGQAFLEWRAANESEAYDFNVPVSANLALYPVFEEVAAETPAAEVATAEEPDEASATVSSFAALRGTPEETQTQDSSAFYTVRFVVDGNTEKEIQVEKDTLVPLYTPASAAATAAFFGWYAEGEAVPWSTTRLLESDVTLTAVFSTDLLVTYYDVDGTELDRVVVQTEADGTAAVAPTEKTVAEVTGQEFAGWLDKSSGKAFDFDSRISRNLELVPDMKQLNLAVFITNGTEIEPQVVAEGGFVEEPTVTVEREGYKFVGWFGAPNTTDDADRFDFENTEIKGTQYIYAGWEAQQVDYYINYWVEKPNMENPGAPNNSANLGNYDYAWSVKRTDGLAGEMTSVDEATANSSYGAAGESVSDLLNFSDWVYSEEKELSGTGTTAINVYYQRHQFSLTFDFSKYEGAVLKNGAGQTFTADGSAGSGVYTIQFKYGQSVYDIWPASFDMTGATNTAHQNYLLVNWGGYFGNETALAGFNQLCVPYTSNTAMAHQYLHKRYVRDDVTVEAKPQAKTNTVRRYYYTEISQQEAETIGLEQFTVAKAGSVTEATAVTGEYAMLTTNNATYSGTRYYRFVGTGVLENQTGWSPASWPGRAIEGYQDISTNGVANTSQFQQHFKYYAEEDPAAASTMAANKNYRINYFMPVKTYTVTLKTNGGTLADTEDYTESGSSLVLNRQYGQAFTVPSAVSKDNYNFAGWYFDEACRNEPYDPAAMPTMPSKNIELYAKFTSTEVTVSYWDNGVQVNEQGYAYGDLFSGHQFGSDSMYDNLRTGDYVPGYGTFKGWYYTVGTTTSAAVQFPDGLPLLKSTYTLTAQWTPENYEVTFLSEGADGEYSQTTDTIAVYSSRNTVARSGQHTPVPASVPAGYTFVGWSTTEKAESANFTAATAVTKDLTVYAVYVLQDVTLTYDANGGVLDMADPTLVVKYGQSLQDANIELAGQSSVSRSDYHFLGWSTKKDSNAPFTRTSALTRNTTVYAQWAVVEPDSSSGTPSSSSTPTDPSPSSSEGTPSSENASSSSTEETTRAPGPNPPATTSSSSSSSAGGTALNTDDTTPTNGGIKGGDTAAEEMSAGAGTTIDPMSVLANDPVVQTQIEEQTGNPVTDIINGNVPLGSLGVTGAWSLLSLIMAIAGAVSSVILLVSMFLRKKKNEQDEEAAERSSQEEEASVQTRRSRLLKALAILPGLLTGILFLVLDNLANPVVLINHWTPWIAVVFVIHLLMVAMQLMKSRKKEDEQEQDMTAQNA